VHLEDSLNSSLRINGCKVKRTMDTCINNFLEECDLRANANEAGVAEWYASDHK